jgi:hypothetical protein
MEKFILRDLSGWLGGRVAVVAQLGILSECFSDLHRAFDRDVHFDVVSYPIFTVYAVRDAVPL